VDVFTNTPSNFTVCGLYTCPRGTAEILPPPEGGLPIATCRHDLWVIRPLLSCLYTNAIPVTSVIELCHTAPLAYIRRHRDRLRIRALEAHTFNFFALEAWLTFSRELDVGVVENSTLRREPAFNTGVLPCFPIVKPTPTST